MRRQKGLLRCWYLTVGFLCWAVSMDELNTAIGVYDCDKVRSGGLEADVPF
jgi:hypothetical protein